MIMITIIAVMIKRENEFEPKLGKPPADHAPKLRGVRTAIRQATRKPQASGPKPRQPAVRAHFAKGSQARPRPVSTASRRVVVKIRYAANAGGRAAALRTHVSYLARDSDQRTPSAEAAVEQTPEDATRSIDYLTREAGPEALRVTFYDRASDGVDAGVVTADWSGDPRHFRMIVSAEDGQALGDLKPFIRELMAGLEAKLGTRLDWLAVDHHDTDNPHSHVLIRGRRPDGQELFIPSKLIASGIREHAQEIVTRVLGPRLDVDLVPERFNDITLKGYTRLDSELLAASRAGPFVPHRPDLAARLERLEGWGLAQRGTAGWNLSPGLAGRLKDLAAHESVARAVAAARPERDPQILLEADRSAPVTGELVHVGPADEFGDRFLAVVETSAGELRYARFERQQDLAVLSGVQPGALVTIAPNHPATRPSDHAVNRVAAQSGGIYSPQAHAELDPYVDSRIIAANIRRLEALRRAGLVQRDADGPFRVGPDHLDNALAFEQRLVRRAPFSAQVVSYWSLGEQIDALGPTQLDHVLAGVAQPPKGEGVLVRDFENALQQRRMYLIELGVMGRDQQRFPQTGLAKLASAELNAQAKALSRELGVPVLTYSPQRVEGIYARRIDLAQGRMALILGERQAHLLPWRPPLERFAGREVEGVMRGAGMSWSLSMGRGVSLGL